MASYEYIGNTIPAPDLDVNNPSTYDQELKYSSVGYSQKGGTLAAGQGVLPLGTVLARRTSDKLWVKWVSGGGDGTGTAAGVLRKTTDTGAEGSGSSGYQANIAFRGSLKLNLFSSANSTSLSAAVTALGGRSNAVLNVFTF